MFKKKHIESFLSEVNDFIVYDEIHNSKISKEERELKSKRIELE